MADPAPVVFVVDDDPSIRRSLANLLRSVGVRVESFTTAQEYLESAPVAAPGCLVLDVRLPGMSGLDLQREIARSRKPRPIVFITGHGDVPMAVQAMKGGAIEFLTKPFREQDLLDAIRRAIDLDSHMRSARALLADLETRFESLSPREREVFQRVVAGLPNKQIAAELGLSEATVKVHRGQVMEKMHASSVPDLVNMHAKLSPRERRI
jgi:RNA polymerase sigma factor (sigma-70 family)